MKVKLTAHTIEAFGENPECRGCGRILWLGEDVYPSRRSERHTYFCVDCFEKKPLLIYPIFPMGRMSRKVRNASIFPYASIPLKITHMPLNVNRIKVPNQKQEVSPAKIVTWEERRQTLQEQRCLAINQRKLIYASFRAFRRMMQMVEKTRLTAEHINEERRFYESLWAQPTKEAFQVLPFRVRTYPWKVLSVHEETVVVEQISKTGTKYRVTYHKSFMEINHATPISLPSPSS